MHQQSDLSQKIWSKSSQIRSSQLPWKAMNLKTMEVVASSLQGETLDVKDPMKKQKKSLFDRYVFSIFGLFFSGQNWPFSDLSQIEGKAMK